MESFQGSKDPITAVTAAPHMLLIGRSSGDVVVYTLPDLVPAGNAAISNCNNLLRLPLACPALSLCCVIIIGRGQSWKVRGLVAPCSRHPAAFHRCPLSVAYTAACHLCRLAHATVGHGLDVLGANAQP